MTEYRDWSITASANTGNAVDGYFKENMAYSDVNDAAREFQAILARDRLDKNGTLVSTGATSSYIVTINATLSAYQDGDIVAFQSHIANDGASTLTLRHPGGSLSARPMVKTNLAPLEQGDIVAGGTYLAYYKSASANFQVVNIPSWPYPVLTKYKTADQSYTSTTSFQDDNHLINFPVVANGAYSVDGCLLFDAAADGPGIAFRLIMSANYGDDCAVIAIGSDTAGTSTTDVALGSTASQNLVFSNFTGFDDSLSPTFSLRGTVFGNGASDATFKLQWAQASSDVNALTLKAGSWIRMTRIA